MRTLLEIFALCYLLPLLVSAILYWFRGRGADWRSADRSSARLLIPARRNLEAVVRIFSARTVSWRGIIATHSWVVIKDAHARAYERFDYTAWGAPIWKDRFVPDGRWFGSAPEIVFAADGAIAARMIPTIRATVRDYRFPHPGDYRLWPGPNANTFVAAVMQSVSMKAALPPTAVGKDFPYDGHWLGWTPSKTGVRLNLGGYLGVTVGWYEGIELNVIGAVAGLDIRRPALKFPGVGRLGMALHSCCPPVIEQGQPAERRVFRGDR
ncbi:MAG TPA: DUF3750 domain-containing protein [Steroidobacteraceae bacterium]